MTRPRLLGRTCPCGASIADDNESGRCKPCGNRARFQNPAFRAKQKAAIQRKFQDPAYLAKMQRTARRNRQKAMLDPVKAERIVRTCRANLALAGLPENEAKRLAAMAGNKFGRPKWLPDQFHAEYKRLTRNRHVKAADARKIIERKMADLEAIRSGLLDEAVFWLNRIAPVSKLPDGTYRYGSTILSPGELMARAKVRGFRPLEKAA